MSTERKQEFGRRADGAKQAKVMLRFVPLGSNRDFNGGKMLSKPYHYIADISTLLDWSEITITFQGDFSIILKGQNLRSILNKLEANSLGCVIEDGLQGAVDDDAETVESLELVEG